MIVHNTPAATGDVAAAKANSGNIATAPTAAGLVPPSIKGAMPFHAPPKTLGLSGPNSG